MQDRTFSWSSHNHSPWDTGSGGRHSLEFVVVDVIAVVVVVVDVLIAVVVVVVAVMTVVVVVVVDVMTVVVVVVGGHSLGPEKQ